MQRSKHSIILQEVTRCIDANSTLLHKDTFSRQLRGIAEVPQKKLLSSINIGTINNFKSPIDLNMFLQVNNPTLTEKISVRLRELDDLPGIAMNRL